MLTQTRVLLVTGEERDAAALRQTLASVGHEIVGSTSIEDGVRRLADGQADVVVLSDDLNDMHGIERLIAAPSDASAVSLIVLHASGWRESRDALRAGASDVIARDAGDDALVVAVERAVRDGQLRREVAALRARVGEETRHALIGRSSGMAHVRELVGRAAASRSALLITGEAGTGKDAVARLVHDLSNRSSRPYVTVRCAESGPEALELELFGRVAAGREAARAGLLEEARCGTIVLDDAGALPTSLRMQLARAVSTRGACRMGASTPLPVDVRVILTVRLLPDGSTNAVHEDLLARFNAMPIVLPPLRERRSDIPLLVQHFRNRIAAEQGIALGTLGPDAMLPLLGHEWSGNVRELEHWVERNALASSAERPGSRSGGNGASGHVDLDSARVTLEELERLYILRVLDQESGHQSRAAVRLGIDRRTLYRKLKQYRLDGVELQQAG